MAEFASFRVLIGAVALGAAVIGFVAYKFRRDRELFNSTAELRAAIDFALLILPEREGIAFLELWRDGLHDELRRQWPASEECRRSYLWEAE